MELELDIERDDVTYHLSVVADVNIGSPATFDEPAEDADVIVKAVGLCSVTLSVFGQKHDVDTKTRILKRDEWLGFEDEIVEAALEAAAVACE